MYLDSFFYQSSVESDEDNILSLQMSKKKTLHTKFLTQLDKNQRMLNRRNNGQKLEKKKQNSKSKTKRGSPNFKQMIKVQKRNVQELKEEASRLLGRSGSRKKVKNSRQISQKVNQRRPSIEKMMPFDFFQSIKQMALELTQNKKYNFVDKEIINEDTNQSIFSVYTQKQFQDGTKFKGICQNGVVLKGQLHFLNQFVYDGQLFLNKFHGKGKLTLPKKQVIKADWIEGQIVGKATIKYPKGQIYYGDIKEYRRHGNGHLFFADQSKYQGQFIDGQLTGYGVHIATSGQKTAGYWFYGDYIGSNEQVYENILNNVAAHQKKKTEKQIKKQGGQKNKNQQLDRDVLGRSFQSQELSE